MNPGDGDHSNVAQEKVPRFRIYGNRLETAVSPHPASGMCVLGDRWGCEMVVYRGEIGPDRHPNSEFWFAHGAAMEYHTASGPLSFTRCLCWPDKVEVLMAVGRHPLLWSLSFALTFLV